MNHPRRVNFLYLKLTKIIWYVVVLGWAIIRTLAVRTVFEKNGVNPWVYLAIDLAASIPYAHFTHQLVLTYFEKDWPRFKRAVVISIITFYAPDVYILLVAKQVPGVVYSGFFLILATFSAFAVFGIYRKIKPRPPK